MEAVLKKLLKYSKFNELLPALNINEIEKFEKSNHISLPSDLIRLLKSFDGGEILIPGQYCLVSKIIQPEKQ